MLAGSDLPAHENDRLHEHGRRLTAEHEVQIRSHELQLAYSLLDKQAVICAYLATQTHSLQQCFTNGVQPTSAGLLPLSAFVAQQQDLQQQDIHQLAASLAAASQIQPAATEAAENLDVSMEMTPQRGPSSPLLDSPPATVKRTAPTRAYNLRSGATHTRSALTPKNTNSQKYFQQSPSLKRLSSTTQSRRQSLIPVRKKEAVLAASQQSRSRRVSNAPQPVSRMLSESSRRSSMIPQRVPVNLR